MMIFFCSLIGVGCVGDLLMLSRGENGMCVYIDCVWISVFGWVFWYGCDILNCVVGV